jgi:hypothetical protein
MTAKSISASRSGARRKPSAEPTGYGGPAARPNAESRATGSADFRVAHQPTLGNYLEPCSNGARYIYRIAPVSPDGCTGAVTEKESVTMIWHVSYKKGEVPGIRIVKGRENAIDTACMLMGSGYDVSQLATNDAAKRIQAQEIRGIYERRKASRSI